MPKKRKYAKRVTRSKNFSNQFSFQLTARKFENKIEQTELIRSNVKYRIQKGLVTQVLMFFKIGYSDTTRQRYLERYDMELPPYFYEAFSYPSDQVPTTAGVMNWIKQTMRNYEDKAEQALEANPDYNLMDIYNLREISLRFFYAEDMPDIDDYTTEPRQ